MADSTCLPLNDNLFGPAVSGCRDDFDFTLLFEQSILSIVPSVLLLLISPFRILELVRRNVKTLPTPIRAAKAITALALFGVQLALLVLWASHSATDASIPSAALSIVGSVVILLLSILEHGRSVRPSSFLNLYLIVSGLFESAQARTLYLRSENHAILALSTISIAVKVALFALENHNKRSYLRLPYKTWSLENTSGIINRIFFWWLNPLFRNGFRKNLSSNDLYFLDPELLSESLEKQMEAAWAKYSSSGRYALVFATVWCLRWQLLMTFFPRLFLIGFNYAQPFLIATAIIYVSTPGGTKNYGYGLIGATFLIYLGIAITSTYFQHRTFRMITLFRGCVVSLIYARTLKIGEGVYDEAKALTLMSTDIDKIAARIESVLEIWANIVSIIIGIWLLERQLGWICIAPIIVTAICTYGSVKVASFMGPSQGVWLAAIQKRVTMTSSMLASMKSIKMMGLSEKMETIIQNQRTRELDLSAKFRWLSICRLVIASTPGLLGPLLTFVSFVIQASAQHSTALSTANAFTSLAIISLLTTPAQSLLSCLPTVTAALASFDRIQGFLLAPSWKDERSEQDMPPNEPMEGGNTVELQTLRSATHEGPALIIDNASVRPSKESPLAIHGISFQIEKGSLTMIVGPIGSGKSTLLKAMLGERACETGTVKFASKQMAYCRQTPWLPNTTVRKTVCGVSDSSEIDMEFYDTVVHACSLEEDISQLPNGHDCLIGSRGVTLSGGQKQRLALARAVYARADLVILDDVLSALDLKTKGVILERLFATNGLFRKHGTTVILATHEIQHLGIADKVLFLDPTGHLVERRAATNVSRLEDLNESVLIENPVAKDGITLNVAPVKTSLPKSLAGPSAKDVDDLTRRTGDISLYKYYFASIGWKLSLLLLLTLVLNTLSTSFPRKT